MRSRLFKPCALSLAAWAPIVAAQAQSTAVQPPVDPPSSTVVVTGSVVQRIIDEAPYAISVIGADTIRSGGPMANLAEVLSQVPGIFAPARSTYSQDWQISSRGFGARSPFGLRGIRLYTDGIPASMPDGQGSTSHFNLAGAQRIEVLRGPFSVLYGNSSGGVVAAYSATPKSSSAELEVDAGSYGLKQGRARLATPMAGGLDLTVDAASMSLDGYRPNSDARKLSGNLRVGYSGESDRVVLQINSLNMPSRDPLGLTRSEFSANPYQSNPLSAQFNTRKELTQTQTGVNWRHLFSDGLLRESQLTAYLGNRSVIGWQSTPTSSQSAATSAGGVVNFDRSYYGFDARLLWNLGALDVVSGVAVESLNDERRGYENFSTRRSSFPVTVAGKSYANRYTYCGISPPPDDCSYGVTGELRRDETNRAQTRDAYMQADWTVSKELVVSGGVRAGSVELANTDRYIKPGNPDDSGTLRFAYTNPVIGLNWKLLPNLRWHVSAARGYESPTLGEVAYAPNGATGFNTSLSAQTSRQFESGLKWREGPASLDATVFKTDTDNEIGVLSNTAGRSVYQNVGRTGRSGLELAGRIAINRQWSTLASVSTLDARYRDTVGSSIISGNRIVGTQQSLGYAEVAWKPAGDMAFALETRASTALTANDINTEAAAGYAVWNLRASKRYTLGQGRQLELLARIDNMADRAYASSVIVNEANSRFYEPGAPRSVFVALRFLGGL